MLFNSQVFIFLFLPLCLLFTYLAFRFAGLTAGKIVLILLSLVFYAYWRIDHVWIILLSIAVNYLGVRLAIRMPQRLRWLGLASLISFNVILIGAFKYYNLILSTVHDLSGAAVHLAAIALPLGISFFSFQQIAYVVDFYRGGRRDDNFVDYSLAVLFFPHLIAGPIVKYRSLIDQFNTNKDAPAGAAKTIGNAETSGNAPSATMGPQMDVHARLFRPSAVGFAMGVTLLAIGLFKKVVFADNFAVYANPMFNAADAGQPFTTLDAWIGAVSFFFQIYFDFSGYTDIAIGLALMFGIALPVNFLSPYMARSIIEFWRRWHITLSTFLRDYVYIALGGNRRGVAMRHINLLLTMLIGGLWHGASWTFVVWGGLHGLYLVINHMYNGMRNAVKVPLLAPERFVYHLITLAAVLFAWIFFRASTFDGAYSVFQQMFNFAGGGQSVVTYEHVASTLPGQFARALMQFGQDANATFVPMWIGLAAAASFVVFFCPNTFELFSRYNDAEHAIPDSLRTKPLVNVRWSPSILWGAFSVIALAVALLSMTQVAQFIYFAF